MSKTALITGASSGIGKDLAYIHAQNNGNLILVARNSEKLNEIKQDIENRYSVIVTTISKDLSKVGAPEELYKAVQELELEVDYLINNAGFGLVGKFQEQELSRLQEMMNLNMLALTSLTHLFLQDFIKKNQGKILNTSSTASLMPGPLQAVYFASKAYVTSFSNAIAEELRETNISVTTLMPGATETEFGAISGMDKTQLFYKPAKSADVAIDGYNAMIKGKLNIKSGLTFSQAMLITAIPFVPQKFVLKQMRKRQETDLA